MSYETARYGWIPDLPAQREHLCATPVALAGALPPSVNLRPDFLSALNRFNQ
jgi:hypothetical protein